MSDVSAKATRKYKEEIRRAALVDHSLVSLTLKSRLDSEIPYRQVKIRPVQIKGEPHLQFSYFTEKQDITKNYRGPEVELKLSEVLEMRFGTVQFQSTQGNWTAQVMKNGKVILHRHEESVLVEIPLSHDREKDLPLPVNRPDTFLTQVGIMDQNGKIRPAMHAKFAQINEFLKLLEHTDVFSEFEHSPIEILDCGCGSAYLSFAAYHYLNDVKRIPARLTGIDYNGNLIEKDAAHAAALDYQGACFRQSAIIDYVPEALPDILLALHACDTATDEAIAQGIRAESHLILCAPCCHHDMRNQLDRLDTPAPFNPVMRNGIIRQRMSELLTDSFRALILRIVGYKTDIVEFVSPEHTDKNLMIRAVRRDGQDTTALVEEYKALKDFWGVTPYLETLLGEKLAGYLHP